MTDTTGDMNLDMVQNESNVDTVATAHLEGETTHHTHNDYVSESIHTNKLEISNNNNNKKETQMAEMNNGWYDPSLHTEHAAIRHDIAVESARLSAQMGAEACSLNQAIGDGRQEQAENFGHTRRDVQATSADLSRQIGKGFCDTDAKVLTVGSDVRREAAEHTNEIIKEGLKSNYDTRGDIKDTRYDLASRVESSADRVVDRVEETKDALDDRFFTVGRDLADIRQGQATLSKDVELNALKTQIEGQKNTQYLSDKITMDGEKTRGLINDLKYHDLNRGLVERNTALINCEQDRDTWRHRHDDVRFNQRQDQFGAQFAQLQTQIQAFASQLQETRQGMVNFGTMAGNAGQQSSTSNNVR